MDRTAADVALRYEPQGAFLVRMCPEPGCFAISCRTSSDPHSLDLAASADGFASSGELSAVNAESYSHVFDAERKHYILSNLECADALVCMAFHTCMRMLMSATA